MKFAIGLALNEPLNHKCINKLKNLIQFVTRYLSFEVIVIAPNNLLLPKIPNTYCYFTTYDDDDSLFDFSRYHRILSLSELKENDILFAFNDTLGNGRKFNFGLYIYLLMALFLLLNDKRKKYNILAPLDSDSNGIWLCPYFFIGRVEFLRSLNFNDWTSAYKLICKPVRRSIVMWLNFGWRHSRTASKQQRNTKFKTLILERAILQTFKKSNLFFMFSRTNFFRIINSIPI